MSKRWSVNFIRPYFSRFGDFTLIAVRFDWTGRCLRLSGTDYGHVAMSVTVLGFGVCVIHWRESDVYGDGGVA